MARDPLEPSLRARNLGACGAYIAPSLAFLSLPALIAVASALRSADRPGKLPVWRCFLQGIIRCLFIFLGQAGTTVKGALAT